TWDRGCNQWMQVQTDRGRFWMHGDTLVNNPLVNDPSGLSDLALLSSGTGNVGVAEVCTGITWAGEALIDELIPLAPTQYKRAVVTSDGVNVRERHGLDSKAPFTLNRGAQVEIMGETFDSNCEQWVQVTTDRELGIFWINGKFLAEPAATATGPGDDDPVPIVELNTPPEQTLITAVCPDAPWTTGFYFFELIALAEEDYRPSKVMGDDVRLRSGVGFDAAEVGRLSKGTPLIVTGEAWDSGCNQWMQVQVNGSRSWVSGKLIE
ncbi:MAG TPA: SH3 domain-containing protein, partial [Nodosilinea sp.]|nr:SH3 domain-containing protein [Nodosilinea sp.]